MKRDDPKAPRIREMLNEVHTKLGFGEMTRSQALDESKCQRCGRDAILFKDDASLREYGITAWCQGCQDDFYE